MQTEYLEKCSNAFHTFSVKEFDSPVNLTITLIVPFSNELYKNLLTETMEIKENIVKYYLKSFLPNIIEVCSAAVSRFPEPKRTYKIVKRFSELKELNLPFEDGEVDLYLNNYFLNELFKVIQTFCSDLDIDFLRLSKEVGFPHESIDRFGLKHKIAENYPGQLTAVFEHCNSVIFECDFITFRRCIGNANLKPIKIIKKEKVFDLVYRLFGIMKEEWYTEICLTMGWEKTIVSGKWKKYRNNKWMKQLDRILPRPLKKQVAISNHHQTTK